MPPRRHPLRTCDPNPPYLKIFFCFLVIGGVIAIVTYIAIRIQTSGFDEEINKIKEEINNMKSDVQGIFTSKDDTAKKLENIEQLLQDLKPAAQKASDNNNTCPAYRDRDTKTKSIKEEIGEALDIYADDKTGKTDFALEHADEQFKSEFIKNLLDLQSSKIEANDVPTHEVGNVKWDDKMTKLLLNSYLTEDENFRNPKIKKNLLWSKISKKLIDKGYETTPDMCNKKFRNLKVTYKGIKDNIKKTGRQRQHWDYFKLMDEIFVSDATINPPLLISSMKSEGAEEITAPVQKISIQEPLPSTSGIQSLKAMQSTALKMQSRPYTASPQLSVSSCTSRDELETPEPAMDDPGATQPAAIGRDEDAGAPQTPVRKSKSRDIQEFRKRIIEIEEQKLQHLQEISNSYKGILEAMKDRNNILQEHLNRK